MTEPLVCCICLTKDRPAMLKRAYRSFLSQTYPRALFLIVDASVGERSYDAYGGRTVRSFYRPNLSIGDARNEACRLASVAWEMQAPDIICHFDDDDWSHPNRITEQVQLIQSSGADCVGYSDLLFWDTRWDVRPSDIRIECRGASVQVDKSRMVNEAWLYTRPSKMCVPGTSLMYGCSVWERKPFPSLPGRMEGAVPLGEDVVWQAGLRVEAVSSVTRESETGGFFPFHEPRMIASLHGSNTMAFGYSQMEHLSEFRRVPEWDQLCAERMKL